MKEQIPLRFPTVKQEIRKKKTIRIFICFINEGLAVALATQYRLKTLVLSVCYMKPRKLIANQMKWFHFFTTNYLGKRYG